MHQIRRRCVLTQATLNLRPLPPVRPELCPLRPLRPVLPELRPLHPVCPELGPLRPLRPLLPELRPLRPVHQDLSLNTIANHDLPLRDADLRGTPQYFLP